MSKSKEDVLYIKFSELSPMTQFMYYITISSTIIGTYFVLGMYLSPMVASGALSLMGFLTISFGVAAVLVGALYLFNKYWLQSKLIEKGLTC